MTIHTSSSAADTVALGKQFATLLTPGDVVALTGELGSGKTQFVIGVCDGLLVRDRVTSPTFTLINEYRAPFGTTVHIDLYRINTVAEVRELGIEEYFNERCICLIEWPEKVREILPLSRWEVSLTHAASEHERTIAIAKVSSA